MEKQKRVNQTVMSEIHNATQNKQNAIYSEQHYYKHTLYLHGGLVLEGAEAVAVLHALVGVGGGVDAQVAGGRQEEAVDHPEHHEDHQTGRLLAWYKINNNKNKKVILYSWHRRTTLIY